MRFEKGAVGIEAIEYRCLYAEVSSAVGKGMQLQL